MMAAAPSSVFVGLLMRCAELAFERDLSAHASTGSGDQLRAELRLLLEHRRAVSRCPQCTRDARARIEPNAPRRTASSYHPQRCPYLRALMAEMADWLSRDPARLAEWHRRAVERYAR
jgi:hypothetical protein